MMQAKTEELLSNAQSFCWYSYSMFLFATKCIHKCIWVQPELQIKGGIENNLKIIFLIPQ